MFIVFDFLAGACRASIGDGDCDLMFYNLNDSFSLLICVRTSIVCNDFSIISFYGGFPKVVFPTWKCLSSVRSAPRQWVAKKRRNVEKKGEENHSPKHLKHRSMLIQHQGVTNNIEYYCWTKRYYIQKKIKRRPCIACSHLQLQAVFRQIN